LDTTPASGFAFAAKFEISESRMFNQNFELANRDSSSPKLLDSNDARIKLEKITISLERSTSIKFLADAKFNLSVNSKTVEFDVKAEYNDGWDFDASMKGTITLREIIGVFASSTAIPPALDNFSFTDLHIAFSTKNKNKHFSGKGVLTVEGTKKISLFLNFDVVDTGNNDPQTDFTGHLEIIPDTTKPNDKYIFDALFEKNN